ncbi:MAG: dihydropteroate synthase, partial [Dehalococcoidia bacterium]|nr:dihydropteroate synthase [Dehalococcoidia bacterium]
HWGARTFIMGIVNLSSDSFSGDGLCSADNAIEQALSFVAQGADIIDVGGESTRPGSSPISSAEEIERLIPFIQRLTRETDMPISIDSYKYDVVQACLEAGANIINDIWGLKYDIQLAELAAEYNAPIIITANQCDHHCDGDIMEAIKTELRRAVDICHTAKVPDKHIIIDPGIGFGKTLEQNLEIVRRLGELRKMGYPILLGTSRKSMIGGVLDMPEDNRLPGTAATNTIGIAQGADIIRVHDVHFMVQIAKMSDAVIRQRRANNVR